MGIRIHKILGYGIHDLSKPRVDKRFNEEFTQRLFEEGGDVNCTDYINWLEEKKDNENTFEVRLEISEVSFYKTSKKTFNPFVYSDECGVFLTIPVVYLDSWKRYDNIIDYYEEVVKGSPNLDWFKVIKGGIHPFIKDEVPKCIEFVCDFCKVFKDKDTVKSFKPLLLNYWS